MVSRPALVVLAAFSVFAVRGATARADDKKPDKKTVAFFKAVREGNLAGIQEAVKNKVDLGTLDPSENTALTIAATAGKADVADALLKAGAKVDQPNGGGATPLMLAARGGHCDLARTFLAAGADKAAVDRRGRTLLSHAIRGGDVAFVKEVLAGGADVNASDENSRTPLMVAAEDGRAEIVGLLLDAKATVNARDTKTSQTALMAAALGGYDPVVTLLLKAGADPALKDNDGQNARELAEGSQHPSTVELLKAKPVPPPSAAKAKTAARPVAKPLAPASATKPSPKP